MCVCVCWVAGVGGGGGYVGGNRGRGRAVRAVGLWLVCMSGRMVLVWFRGRGELQAKGVRVMVITMGCNVGVCQAA